MASPWTRTLLAALATVAVFPAAAGAQSRTLGSPLAQAPNVGFGCETKPTLTAESFDGFYRPRPSGTADCTWFQSGVIGSVDYSDPRTGSVPADGTITNVAIRTGPPPVPAMGIVIVRQIGGVLIGGGSTSVCCGFVSETPLPPLAPNTINSIPVNIPVERNIRGTSAVADYVGISAISGTGQLPLFSNGRNNILSDYTFGQPDAGFWYPRMGAQEAPGGGTRNNESIPGVEVLLQWTWTPAGGTPTPPVPPTQPPTPTNPGAATAPTPQATAAANARRALIQLACGANAACQGQLELLSRGAGVAAKPKLYGSTTYAIGAGQSAEVKVKLNRKGKALLRKRKNATVSLRLSPAGGTPVVSALKLKR